MNKQITNIATMLIMAVCILASAVTAQNKDGSGIAPVGVYTGIETMEGTLDPSDAIRFGNSFVLNSFGEWESHHLSVSMDYSNASINSRSLMVTGGSWSLVVVRDNQYFGTLYGDIQSGSVSLVGRKGELVEKQVQAILRATGGTGAFDSRKFQIASIVYAMTTNIRSGQSTGSASFVL